MPEIIINQSLQFPYKNLNPKMPFNSYNDHQKASYDWQMIVFPSISGIPLVILYRYSGLTHLGTIDIMGLITRDK
jgi:hypothetical protein